MAILEKLQGIMKLREAWRKIERNEEAINKEIVDHKESKQAHKAEDITYTGDVTGATTTKQAIDNVQTQLNVAVISGDSSPAAAQAAVDADGHDYENLKLRLDTEHKQVTAQLAEKTTYIKAKNVTYNYQLKQRPLVTFIDDDGRVEAYTKLKPRLDAKGVKGSTAIVTGYVGTNLYMSQSQINDLDASGWEIMSHTVTHRNLDTLSDAEIKNEIYNSADILRKLYNVRGFVYPYGGMVKPIIHKYTKDIYEYAFGGFGRANLPLRSTAITRIVLGDNTSLDFNYFKSHIDLAVQEKAWLVICTHCGPWGNAMYDLLDQVIDYIKSLRVDIVTPSEGYELFGNAAENYNDETGDYYIAPKLGGLHSSNLKASTTIKYGTGINVNTPITEFEKDKVTITSIYASESAGFPTGSGTLETYRNKDDVFDSQTWTDILNRDIYKRSWTGSEWGVFNHYRRRDLRQYTINVDARAIAANTQVDVLLPVNELVQGCELIVYPNTTIESGIIYNFMYGNSTNVRLRLSNVTGASVSMAARTWTVLVAIY